MRHSGLTVDGHDPYPPNKPYYAPGFRHLIGGPHPAWDETEEGPGLTWYGHARLTGVRDITRRCHFTQTALTVRDTVGGWGRRSVERRLITPAARRNPRRRGDPERQARGAIGVTADTGAELFPVTRWTAYGEGEPATLILFAAPVGLPFTGHLTIEVI